MTSIARRPFQIRSREDAVSVTFNPLRAALPAPSEEEEDEDEEERLEGGVSPAAVQNDLCERIKIGCHEVLHEMGIGHSERTHQNALQRWCSDEHIPFDPERVMPLTFRGAYVGQIRSDLVVGVPSASNRVVLELKNYTAKGGGTIISAAIIQCRRYMECAGIAYGMVIGFPTRKGADMIFQHVSL